MVHLYDTARGDYSSVPLNADAVAPYMDGLYKNDAAARARFPHLAATGRLQTITCRRADADILDWEYGNTCPPPVDWWNQQHGLGRWRPCYYANQSDMRKIIPPLERAIGSLPPPGPARPIRLWVAHPIGYEHLCGPATCGFPWQADATQYWWSSLQGGGPDIDISVCREDFFPVATSPEPPEDTMAIAATLNQKGHVEVFVELQSGEVKHTWQEEGGVWHGAQQGVTIAKWESLGRPDPR